MVSIASRQAKIPGVAINALWKWVRRFAPRLFEADGARRPKVIVDETSMNLGGEMIYLHVATIPDSRHILAFKETKNCMHGWRPPTIKL